jgi:Protein of unknown function (DUF2550)
MAWWQEVLDGAGLFGLVALLSCGLLFLRRRLLGKSSGAFECSLRVQPPTRPSAASGARGWTLGLGRYRDTSVEWFRIFSFSPHPKYVFDRSLTVLSSRQPTRTEALSLYGGHVVVAVRLHSGQPVELAMSASALTGFLAWVEAAPPVPDRIFE